MKPVVSCKVRLSKVENREEFTKVLEQLRLEMEELEALRAAADALRSFREKLLVDDARFD